MTDLLKRRVHDGDVVRVEFLDVGGDCAQSLNLSFAGPGRLEVGGELRSDVALFTDTTPREIELRCVLHSQEDELHVWNGWRGAGGENHGWIGNSGMRIDERDDGAVVLSCSDGDGPRDFNDLVVLLRWM